MSSRGSVGMRASVLAGVVAALLAASVVGGLASQAAAAPPVSTPQPAIVRTLPLGDGTKITEDANGVARHVDAHGTVLAQQHVPSSPGRTALGDTSAPTDDMLRQLFAPHAPGADSGQVLAVLSGATVTGAARAGQRGTGLRAPVTSDARVNAALSKVGAVSIRPLLAQLPSAATAELTSSARSRLGAGAPDLGQAVVVQVQGHDAASAAATLRATAGVSFAEPDRYVSGMTSGAHPLPALSSSGVAPGSDPVPAGAPGLPDNYGLTSSLQSFLNAGGVDAVGAYSELTQRFGQLPGTGETITNVSVGDLTDQGMADAGDPYVQYYGPTTVVSGGQRYLDLPSMPLIPTYTAAPDGSLDPLGSTENQDPLLGEVLLDFGVMAPLPHDQQRTGALGSAETDLLGIAPGAKYRLVVPQQPTIDQIAVALLAAAQQTPRPDVITASLGFGTDSEGFPGRYLEDDPVTQAVIAAIVQQYHIVVCISSNDGTRLYTPAAVGPDGGSTPTNVSADPTKITSIDDDAESTTPTVVRDSGAIAVGGTTLDDTLAVPPQAGAAQSRNATFATTRTDGSGAFSSGFGTRVNVSAPSDGIVVFEHQQGGSAQAVTPVLSGGTSASAPMTAAAAAIVLQAGRLSGQDLTPAQVRATLAATGRPVATPPQADQPINVGPQIDVTAAVDSVLGNDRTATAKDTRIVRLSVAHRVTVGQLGAEFLEETDPGRIDLSGNGSSGTGSGEGLVGPVTIGADVTGLPRGDSLSYRLVVGDTHVDSPVPAIRLTPTELLQDAGLPVISASDRTLTVTFQVLDGTRVIATADHDLTFGPTDGTFAEAPAPVVAPVAPAGQPVQVSYDLTGVRDVANPQLVVSTVGHWNPVLAPIFTAAYSVALTGTSGTITVPASAFDGGGGIYGIGIIQSGTTTGQFANPVYGEFASVRIAGGKAAQRPDAPTLAPAGADTFAHAARVTMAAPSFDVRYDTSGVPGAAGTAVEISAPAPTLFNSMNTVTNANGTVRDNDGVDAGAMAYQEVPGTRGTARIDANALGLVGSDSYNVRVFATDGHGHLLGQASPTSLLTFDDGQAPGDGEVASFAADGGDSVVAVRGADGGHTLQTYNTATGTYGAVLAADADPADSYDVLGTDPASHRALVLHSQGDATALETYDTSAQRAISAAALSPSEYTFVGGRVDAAGDRGVLLVHRVSDNADVVLTLDLATGTLGAPLLADTSGIAPGRYKLLTIDAGSGIVYLSASGGSLICFSGGVVARVDLDTSTVTAQTGPGCVNAIEAEQATHTLYQLSYRSVSVNIAGNSVLTSIDGGTLQAVTTETVRQQPSMGMAVDSTHHLALIAFQAPMGVPHFGNALGQIHDNNATSQFAVVDLTTGAVVGTVAGFNFTTGAFHGESGSPNERSVQLDPATRTGWVIAADATQVQHFAY